MLDTKIDHDCGARRCSAVCRGYHLVSAPTSPSLPPLGKADTGAAPKVSKPHLNFCEDCGVLDLAQKINLNLSGIVKSRQKSLLKEPITDTKESKEATKSALSNTFCRKERLFAKAKLLETENALRRQLISQQAALARANHALHLRRQRTKLYTAHQFRLGSILSSHQPFLDDALAEVKLRRHQQAAAAESVHHLHLVSTVARLAPAGKYVNLRPVPIPTPLPALLPPSNRSLWCQNRSSSWTPAPMPFKLESFSASRTRVVHVHHHHYQESVVDSEDFSEDESVVEEEDDFEEVEDEYIEDDYYSPGDCYEEEDDAYSDGEFSGEEEDFFDKEGDCSDSEFSGEDQSDFAYTTSCDEASCSGYEESSY